MALLPIISAQEYVKALEKVGYSVSRQRDSHVRLVASGRNAVTVPMHKTLDRGTLRSIIRTTELTVDQFIQLLG